MRKKIYSPMATHGAQYPIAVRSTARFGLLFSIILLSVAYCLEYKADLKPCPLCWLQRGVVFSLGLSFLFTLIHRTQKIHTQFSYSLLISGLSFIGLGLAARHTWLQYSPSIPMHSCSADIQTLLSVLPLQDVLTTILKGTADCSKIQWQFLSLSLAQWMLCIFFFYFIISLRLLFLAEKRRQYLNIGA